MDKNEKTPAFPMALNRSYLKIEQLLNGWAAGRYYKKVTAWDRLLRAFGDRHGLDLRQLAHKSGRDIMAEAALAGDKGMLRSREALATELYGPYGQDRTGPA